MKKFTNLALAGAIAMGGLGVTSVADLPGLSAPSADAAYVQDDFQGVQLSTVQNNLDAYMGVNASYKTGDTFSYDYSDGGTLRYTPDHVKIYKVMGDGSLHRYKTITAQDMSVDGGNYQDQFYRFTTPITSVYTAGTYIAVHTYQYEYAGGNLSQEQERSVTFTINK